MIKACAITRLSFVLILDYGWSAFLFLSKERCFVLSSFHSTIGINCTRVVCKPNPALKQFPHEDRNFNLIGPTNLLTQDSLGAHGNGEMDRTLISCLLHYSELQPNPDVSRVSMITIVHADCTTFFLALQPRLTSHPSPLLLTL